MEIRKATADDAVKIAKIHKEEIKTGFLSSLGEEFLTEFYKAIIGSDSGFCFVVEEGNDLVGFISGAENIGKIYKGFLKKHFLKSSLILLPKIFNLSVFKKILEVLLYPKKESSLPQAELITIAIKRDFQNRGLGSQLLIALNSEMKNRGVAIYKVLVGKELEKSINFYKKNNFEFLKETAIHKETPSIILIYRL